MSFAPHETLWQEVYCSPPPTPPSPSNPLCNFGRGERGPQHCTEIITCLTLRSPCLCADDLWSIIAALGGGDGYPHFTDTAMGNRLQMSPVGERGQRLCTRDPELLCQGGTECRGWEGPLGSRTPGLNSQLYGLTQAHLSVPQFFHL